MNQLIRPGGNAFTMILFLPTVAIFALALTEPSYHAAQPDPLVEKVGERYMMVARNHSGFNCYESNFIDISNQTAYDTLWAQVIRIGDLPAPVSTEIICTDCHCATCDATTEHLADPARDVKANTLTLRDFLNQGQYAPLLTRQ